MISAIINHTNLIQTFVIVRGKKIDNFNLFFNPEKCLHLAREVQKHHRPPPYFHCYPVLDRICWAGFLATC